MHFQYQGKVIFPQPLNRLPLESQIFERDPGYAAKIALEAEFEGAHVVHVQATFIEASSLGRTISIAGDFFPPLSSREAFPEWRCADALHDMLEYYYPGSRVVD